MEDELVWIREDDEGARYDHVKLSAGTATISQLTEAWSSDVRPRTHRSRISFRSVPCAGTLPTKEEEARAREQAALEPPLPLAAAGVCGGCFLLASISRRASSSRSGSEEESPPRLAPPAVPQLSASDRLQALLAEVSVPPLSEHHLAYLREHFSSQLLVAATAEDAVRLRSRALQAPRSTTLRRLELSDLFVAREPLVFSSSSRSLFFRAFRSDGQPRLLKVPNTEGSAALEVDTWNLLASRSVPQHLAGPLELVMFTRDAGQGPRSAVLLPIYACTLADAPSGLFTPTRALVVADALQTTLGCMHAAGLCHCDVKASNVFLHTDGGMHLGDFGATTRTGEPLTEFSVSHLPLGEAAFNSAALLASPQLDHWLLLTTLLDLTRLLSPPSSHSVHQVACAVARADGMLLSRLNGLLDSTRGLWD